MKPKVEIETWTPTRAKTEMEEQEQRIAKGDYRNRPLSERTVNRYANDMRQGHWLVNNQGIGFDAEGNLLDGRHRLWAVVKSGASVDMLTFRGLESKKNGSGFTVNPIDTIDCGRVRTMGNQFVIDGVRNAMVTASIVRAIAFAVCHPMDIKIGTVPGRAILDYYKGELEIISTIVVNKRIRSAFIAPAVIYAKVKPRIASQFLKEFSTLVGLQDGSPVIALDAYARSHSGHAGTGDLKKALCATSLALYHYNNDTKVNMIRHSTIGMEWLQKEAKQAVGKILKFVGRDKVEE